VHEPDLTEADAARIIRRIVPPVQAVLITYLDDAGQIAELAAALGVHTVQLHGEVGLGTLARLKSLDPSLLVVKSLVVGRKPVGALESAARLLAPLVDAFITDTFDPATGASGATGKTHDWAISRRLVEVSSRPVILAGGLTPENVGEAIRRVRPAGVDSHSGVEDASGRKDRDRVCRFVAEAREQLASLETRG
jgi:phosphoribosylanthranilate isomerase